MVRDSERLLRPFEADGCLGAASSEVSQHVPNATITMARAGEAAIPTGQNQTVSVSNAASPLEVLNKSPSQDDTQTVSILF